MTTSAAVKTPNQRKRILIVDDHPLMREGLAQWINREADLQVCGEAGTSREALEAIGRLKPDLVMLDVSLAQGSGLDLLKDIRAMHPKLSVLMLSMHDESLYAERALRAGARGYLMKNQSCAEIVKAVRDVLGGGLSFSPQMSRRFLEVAAGRRSTEAATPLKRLSDRELEVFQMVGLGRSSKEIADELHVSIKTIEAARAKIREKLGVHSAAEMVRYAVICVEGNQLPAAPKPVARRRPGSRRAR